MLIKLCDWFPSKLPGQPNVNSHSFRIGYISQFWKDSKDIEFVKQTIGHRKLETTSTYITQLFFFHLTIDARAHFS